MGKLASLLLWVVAFPGWAAESYTLDPGHTFPSFEIRHHGVSTLRGKFNRAQGRAVLDPEGGTGHIEVTVATDSVDTGLDDLNGTLRGLLFFQAGRFPEIRFVSDALEYRDGKPVAATGNLTILNETRPVRLEIRDFTCTTHFLTRKWLCGADASATIRRSEFGMTFGLNLIGDEVKLAIEVEGYRD